MVSTIETMPAQHEPGTTRIAKSKRYGRKLSKLADNTAAVVRSEDEQKAHDYLCAFAIVKLVKRRKEIRAERQHNVTLAIRKLTAPMYGIDIEGMRYFVSANVLSDYRRERIPCVVVSMPVPQRFGRIAGVRKSDVDMFVHEQSLSARGNDHAMGLAQNAWRFAHLEKVTSVSLSKYRDETAIERAAYYWLFHGNLKPCNAPVCKCCGSANDDNSNARRRRRMQAAELATLAYTYLEPDSRSRFNGSRNAHRMASPTLDRLESLFRSGFRTA